MTVLDMDNLGLVLQYSPNTSLVGTSNEEASVFPDELLQMTNEAQSESCEFPRLEISFRSSWSLLSRKTETVWVDELHFYERYSVSKDVMVLPTPGAVRAIFVPRDASNRSSELEIRRRCRASRCEGHSASDPSDKIVNAIT